jgi:hypothetical protein
MIPIIPGRGTVIAKREASIFVHPNQGPYQPPVQANESVTLLGQGAAPWSSWLYVHRQEDDLKGFVWKPFFERPQLELVSLEMRSFCAAGQKRFGFELVVQGGDDTYAFYWEEQEGSDPEERSGGGYLVSWLWGTAPNIGELTVVSGDGQTVSSKTTHFSEPRCP